MTEEIEVLQEPEITDATKAPSKEKAAFANDVLKLSFGTFFVQVENFLVSMILARIFLPDHFGVANLFMSITSVLVVIVFARYEASVMLPKSKEEGANLFAASFLIGILFSLAMLPLCILGKDWISRILNAPELGPYLWLIPLSTFMTGLVTLLGFWNTRSRQYLRQSTNKIVNQVFTDGSRLGLGIIGQVNSGSLIVGNLFGTIVADLQLAYLTWRDDNRLFLKSVSFRGMLAGITRYKKFPIYTSWAALLNAASTQLPSFLLAAFFSTDITGFYGMGQRVLRLPIGLVGGAIGQVFYQRAARARHEGGLAELVKSTFRTLIIFGAFPMLLLTIAGREIFIVFFGARWSEAGLYSQILGPWTFFLFLSSPLSSLTNLHERQEIGLLLNIFLFVTRVISLLVGGLLRNIYLGLELFTVSGILAYGWFSLWATSASGVPVRTTLRDLGENLLFSSPFLAAIAISKWIFHLAPLIVVAISALAGILYYAAVVWKTPDIQESFLSIYQKYRERLGWGRRDRS